MPINIDEEKKIFTIHTKKSSYQFQAGPHGYLLHLYYGPRLVGDAAHLLTYADRGFSGNPYDAGTDRSFSLDALPQEYPCYGNGDFRSACLQIRQSDGSFAVDLRYERHELREGKYSLKGLPAAYVSDVHAPGSAPESNASYVPGLSGAQTLELVLKDRYSELRVHLLYAVFEDSEVICRSARIENAGSSSCTIYRALSGGLDFLYGNYELLHFHGRHGMERRAELQRVEHAALRIGSRRGTSSHQHNPFVALTEAGCGEDFGACYGLCLVYSGNFIAEAERDQYEQTRVLMGLSDEFFEWPLAPGECFETPELLLCYSSEGYSALSHSYHRLMREHLCRGAWKLQRRPVLINNWEATYFDFDGEQLYRLARQAAELGVEMLVLDDGWFGKRSSDCSGLGDWFVNEEKLGGSLRETVERIRGLGMRFGLWIEPEMVSEDSELFRAHPDWAFRIPGREPVRGRYQLVLDFSRPEVVDAVLMQLVSVIEAAGVDYIKMDMNRHLTDIFTHGGGVQNQGVIMHRYVLGVYDFLERLLARFPQLLIEGCSGGGGRFDAGMLYYTPQIWCSDNTDAIERLSIQYGSSFAYPVSAVGAHVSAVPNHQTGRISPLETRAVVAMSGSFGYELDLNLLSDGEKAAVRQQIEAFKRYWPLLHEGNYYRLTPAESVEFVAWEQAAADGQACLLSYVMVAARCNGPQPYVRLKGLCETALYRLEGTDECFSGSALMHAGYPLPRASSPYQAGMLCFRQFA